MRIAVIGAGNVGGTLGRRWADAGHVVAFGVRQPDEGADAIRGSSTRVRVGEIGQALQGADVVLLATPWSAVSDALERAGASAGALDGLPLLDATNPLGAGLALQAGPHGESGAERIQAMVPAARVVKIFNTTGYENMQNPAYSPAASAMFYAGDDRDAKATARSLASALGFEPFDVGALRRARELEHLAVIWISLATGAGGAEQLGRQFALALVRR